MIYIIFWLIINSHGVGTEQYATFDNRENAISEKCSLLADSALQARGELTLCGERFQITDIEFDSIKIERKEKTVKKTTITDTVPIITPEYWHKNIPKDSLILIPNEEGLNHISIDTILSNQKLPCFSVLNKGTADSTKIKLLNILVRILDLYEK